ncbi:hypothetical protein Cva_01588 [Caedimonas varicaedens]|uniref:Uncharacterized protein n=1 Tax=Caedimonas varicaedens TaxID=1629334 RepID=A0A0K8MFB9_9PROT|nr:hypothetical protein Cva_01588 [Caedimonas varicaedens]
MKYPPLHMSYNDRMERLYNFLLSLGLVVLPICDDEERIDYLHVRVDLPFTQKMTEESSKSADENVVKFPSFE